MKMMKTDIHIHVISSINKPLNYEFMNYKLILLLNQGIKSVKLDS